MKLLVITGSMCPSLGHNANLSSKLIPFLKKNNEVHYLSWALGAKESDLPKSFKGLPIHWATGNDVGKLDKKYHRLVSSIVDKNGFSDYYQGYLLAKSANLLYNEYKYDAVLATSEPFAASVAAMMITHNVIKGLYLMDPPEAVWAENVTSYREKKLKDILKSFDVIFTATFAKQSLEECGYYDCIKKLVTVGFPMIEKHKLTEEKENIVFDPNKINLFFCGCMSKYLKRSPKYYLNICERLDVRFRLYFMGKECDKICEDYDFHPNTEVVFLPQQKYQVALNAMHATDVLINIGNNVKAHVPSKIMEYVSTDMPFVNFYKFEGCPTLEYTERYPMALNLLETKDGFVSDEVFEKFVNFCVESKGKTVDHDWVEKEYHDCTPEYIAKTIEENLRMAYGK